MGLRRRSGPARSDTAEAGSLDVAGADASEEPVEQAAARPTRRSRRAAARAGAGGDHEGKPPRTPLTPARARRLIGVGKAVLPLLAPYALAAAGVARAQWDARRAARLGVAPDQLSAYSGRGGALHARLSRLAEALAEIESGPDGRATEAAQRFAGDIRPRLADLDVAVRAAEQMPAPRRRTAFRAVGGELDRIEAELLTHLGVRT
jgi:hypothetical protein